MKKILLILLCTIPIVASAQKIRFTDPANRWIAHGYQGIASFGEYFSWGTDTVMYSHTYKPMLDTCIWAWGSSDHHYFVREDTMANMVYYREPASDTSEHIMYNYNLQAGDSVNTGTVTDSVVSVDSVVIRGVYHKVFTLHGKNDGRAYSVIEGIGATNSPVWPPFYYSGAEYSEQLLCFTQGAFMPAVVTPSAGTVDSFRNGADNCYPLSVTVPMRKSLTLYPNPAVTSLTITSPEKITTISIANFLGQTVFANEYNSEKVEVDVSRLRAGVYFLKVNGGEVRKFVKE